MKAGLVKGADKLPSSGYK